jgi:hypothetical protein
MGFGQPLMARLAFSKLGDYQIPSDGLTWIPQYV